MTEAEIIQCWMNHKKYHEDVTIHPGTVRSLCTTCDLRWVEHVHADAEGVFRTVCPNNALEAAFNQNRVFQWPLDPVTLLGMLA